MEGNGTQPAVNPRDQLVAAVEQDRAARRAKCLEFMAREDVRCRPIGQPVLVHLGNGVHGFGVAVDVEALP